ncbi:hypothetical protein GLAREA_03248 [Glarea lozoyensis ATCC 20868]|uniref:DUF1763-domain-containing protein n=1 Tax=Glarea lozoyensis (strain ATCC 20868 / MF5171) TaxID=1116229 RepID=S3DLA6_GLAL2|nr:uncharacterized protein GLAREA_03248 [Glarea lozoyensis ATCC 20868]EPE27333.1 hypothetical protein GLAREA_03248 [Glarea lozoyensis ATCC 20868]
MSTPTAIEVIHAYRHLYRGLLHGVQFSKPARYIARDTLREAFRSDPPSMFNQKRIDNTVEFLGYAAKEAGLEHKILRNLLFKKSWERRYGLKPKLYDSSKPESTKDHLERTATYYPSKQRAGARFRKLAVLDNDLHTPLHTQCRVPLSEHVDLTGDALGGDSLIQELNLKRSPAIIGLISLGNGT